MPFREPLTLTAPSVSAGSIDQTALPGGMVAGTKDRQGYHPKNRCLDSQNGDKFSAIKAESVGNALETSPTSARLTTSSQ